MRKQKPQEISRRQITEVKYKTSKTDTHKVIHCWFQSRGSDRKEEGKFATVTQPILFRRQTDWPINFTNVQISGAKVGQKNNKSGVLYKSMPARQLKREIYSSIMRRTFFRTAANYQQTFFRVTTKDKKRINGEKFIDSTVSFVLRSSQLIVLQTFSHN